MRRSLGTALVVAVVSQWFGIQPGSAEDLAQSWQWCVNKDHASPDLQIGGCTAVIQSGRLTRKNLTFSFNSRGNAYLAKGSYDLAIADYDQAIKLDGRDAVVFRNRGLAYFSKKEFDRTIADDNKAIQLAPQFSDAFNDRGLAYRSKGNLDQAIADFNRAVQLNPKFSIAINNRDAALKAKSEVASKASSPPADAADLKVDQPQPQSEIYRRLNLFGDVFERVRDDYVTEPDDWKLIEGAIHGLSTASGIAISQADESSLCKEQLADHTTSGALQCFGSVYDHLHQVAGHKLQEGELFDAAISGMVGTLDPHSRYLNAKTWGDSQVASSGNFGGIGVDITMENGLVEVTAPIANSPAQKSGVQPGDAITEIDGQAVQGLTLEQAVEKIKGAVGSKATLTILRKGKPLDVTMTREVIRTNPVQWHAEGDQIGYIRIAQFNEKTTGELKEAIDGLEGQLGSDSIRGFIIDLRDDPGGLLDQASSVSATFLDRGEIFTTRARKEMVRFTAKGGDLTRGKSLIVLIDGKSAAASEIVAGALQDYKRATILGTHSFGEGSIQTIIPLGADNGGLTLTTAMFFLPSGRKIDGTGIVPDIVVAQQDGSLSHDAKSSGAPSANPRLDSDVPPHEKDDKALQLAIGLMLGTKTNPAFPPGRETNAVIAERPAAH